MKSFTRRTTVNAFELTCDVTFTYAASIKCVIQRRSSAQPPTEVLTPFLRPTYLRMPCIFVATDGLLYSDVGAGVGGWEGQGTDTVSVGASHSTKDDRTCAGEW